MRRAAERGMVLIFNPLPVNVKLATYPLACLHWFVMNEIEGTALTGETEPKTILAAMVKFSPDASVALTLGVEGACLSVRDTHTSSLPLRLSPWIPRQPAILLPVILYPVFHAVRQYP
jgi:sugar/nucleoside kinase (ribokinase family)